MLPHHAGWMRFLARLEYVVIDELHLFRGIFGSHVAHVLRRLRRLAAHYGADPTFICTSATIGEPAELASRDHRGRRDRRDRGRIADRRAGRRDLEPSGARRRGRDAGVEPHGEAAGLVAELVGDEPPDTRASAPAAGRPRSWPNGSGGRCPRPTPGGWPPTGAGSSPRSATRSNRPWSTARLDAVLATSALELGVDFEGLDACVLDGFPGTVASMWQRIGRAGRQPAGVARRARVRRRPARPVGRRPIPTSSSSARPSPPSSTMPIPSSPIRTCAAPPSSCR